MAKLSVDKALLKAKFHAKKGEVEEAQNLYQAVLQSFPKNKRAQEALAALNKPKQPAATQGPPQDTINQLINLYNQGQLTKAIEQANTLTGQYPEAFVVWNVLGAANNGLGRVEEASEAFKKVTVLNPNYADGFNNLGVALKNQGKMEEAVDAYNKALSINPDYAEAYNNMGAILQNQGKLEEAVEAYNKAVAINPDYADAYYNMGATLNEQGKLEEAVEAYNKVLSIKTDYAEAYNNLGGALNDQGKLEEAIETYNKVLSIKPDYAEVYYNMGNTLSAQGKQEEAIEAYNKALSLKPNDADTHLNIGVVLKEQGKLEEAIEAYEKALTMRPHYAEAYYNTIELLKLHSNVSSSVRGLIDIDRQSKEFGAKLFVSSTDQEIAAIVSETLGFINRAEFKFKTPGSQLYKRNAVDLNCSRHTKIFDQKSIIPEFCFGCFKVQVEVNDLFSLIKLSKLFYDLNFETDLTRKTMIEMRPEIPGFYKGLFYCRGLKQARNVKETLDADLNFTFGGQIVSKIKRGCSEFPLKFPDYGKIKNDREVKMDFPIDWKPEEDQFDQDTLIKPKENLIPSRSEFSLSDFYIIQKWIDYSKGLNDPSCEWFEDLPIVFPNVYDIAVGRKTKFGKVF